MCVCRRLSCTCALVTYRIMANFNGKELKVDPNSCCSLFSVICVHSASASHIYHIVDVLFSTMQIRSLFTVFIYINAVTVNDMRNCEHEWGKWEQKNPTTQKRERQRTNLMCHIHWPHRPCAESTNMKPCKNVTIFFFF